MQPAGVEIFNKRKREESKLYSFENAGKQLAQNLEKKFKANKAAWSFFTKQAPSYKKMIVHWITSAKREETQLTRLEQAITESVKQKRIGDQYKKR